MLPIVKAIEAAKVLKIEALSAMLEARLSEALRVLPIPLDWEAAMDSVLLRDLRIESVRVRLEEMVSEALGVCE